jgi:hypothetical protein
MNGHLGRLEETQMLRCGLAHRRRHEAERSETSTQVLRIGFPDERQAGVQEPLSRQTISNTGEAGERAADANWLLHCDIMHE